MCVFIQTLQFIKNVTEKTQSSLLLTTMTPPLLGHMTSCLLACDVCPPGKEPPGIRPLGEVNESMTLVENSLFPSHSHEHSNTTCLCM